MEKNNFLDKYAKLLVITAVIFGGTSGAFGAIITAPSSVIGFWRLTMSLPFFALPLFLSTERRKKLADIIKNERTTLVIMLATGFFLFAHFYCWYSAVKLTNISGAAVLSSFHPIVVLFATIFIYKKKVDRRAILCIIIALAAGAYMMSSDISDIVTGRMLGNIFALATGIFMGLYFAVGGKVRAKVDGTIYVFVVFASCWFSFFVANLILGESFFGYPAKDYFYIACLALFCQIGAHAIWNFCIGHVSPLYVSTVETADSVASTLLAILIIGQYPTVTELVCCIIVVTALLFYNKYENAAENANEDN